MLNKKIITATRIVEDLGSIALQHNLHPLLFVKKHYSATLDVNKLDAIKLKAHTQAHHLKKEADTLNINYQCDDYIQSKTKKVSPDMLRIYRNMKMHLEAFAQFSKKQITFNCLDLNFYEAFVNFLTRDYTLRRRTAEVKGLRINSIGMTVKELRAFLRNRIRKRIIAPIAMDGWKIIEERKSTRSTCRGRRSTGSKTLRLTGSRS